MRWILSFAILAVMTLTLASVSASVLPTVCATVETTFVSGRVYNQNTGANISGAAVTVTCRGHERHVTSGDEGGYSAQYPATDCTNGDEVSVSATYDGLNGESNTVTWYTDNYQVGCLKMIINVACADVPLIPEFGLVIGTLTVLSAIGVFFLVRRN